MEILRKCSSVTWFDGLHNNNQQQSNNHSLRPPPFNIAGHPSTFNIDIGLDFESIRPGNKDFESVALVLLRCRLCVGRAQDRLHIFALSLKLPGV
jgi:hypothetical protein